MNTLQDKVLSILQEVRPEFDFAESEDFIAEGMLDSFDVVQLVTGLDETFGISIDGTDILPDNFSSVDKIIGLLHKNGVTP